MANLHLQYGPSNLTRQLAELSEVWFAVEVGHQYSLGVFDSASREGVGSGWNVRSGLVWQSRERVRSGWNVRSGSVCKSASIRC